MTPATCLILLLVALAGCVLVAGQLYEDNPCPLSNQRTGICRLIDNCASVYNDLLAGRPPEKNCGWQGGTPIVCCPVEGGSGTTARPTNKPTPSRVTTSKPIPPKPTTKRPATNVRISKRMCSVYAQSVYALVEPPVLSGGDSQLVNVSLCAIKNKKLIVGGTRAEPKEFPHMAAVGFNSGKTIRWDCGGTLISDTYVLTAAHCTSSIQWGDAQWVRVGDLNLRIKTDEARIQDRRVAQRIRYPDYQRPAQYHDIALLRLQSAVTFDAYVRPACLSLESSLPTGTKAVATGWGIVDWYDEEGSDDLLKVTLPIVSHQQCVPFFRDDGSRLPSGINEKSQLCAGQDGKDTCQGDSGGPLVVFNKNEECMYDIIGITSFGKLCGSVSPGIYTKVYNYLSWIETVVWPNVV